LRPPLTLAISQRHQPHKLVAVIDSDDDDVPLSKRPKAEGNGSTSGTPNGDAKTKVKTEPVVSAAAAVADTVAKVKAEAKPAAKSKRPAAVDDDSDDDVPLVCAGLGLRRPWRSLVDTNLRTNADAPFPPFATIIPQTMAASASPAAKKPKKEPQSSPVKVGLQPLLSLLPPPFSPQLIRVAFL
jgi:hypothetical protein